MTANTTEIINQVIGLISESHELVMFPSAKGSFLSDVYLCLKSFSNWCVFTQERWGPLCTRENVISAEELCQLGLDETKGRLLTGPCYCVSQHLNSPDWGAAMLSMKLPMHPWDHVNFNWFALSSWQCIKPTHWSLRLFHINMAWRTHQVNWRWNGRTVAKELCWVSQLTVLTRQYRVLTVLTRQYKVLRGSF